MEHPTTFHMPLDGKAWIIERKVWKETHKSSCIISHFTKKEAWGIPSLSDLPPTAPLVNSKTMTRHTSFSDRLPNFHSLLDPHPQSESSLKIEEK